MRKYDFDIEIIRTDRRSIGFQVKEPGKLIIRAPRRISVQLIEEAIDSKMKWIQGHVWKGFDEDGQLPAPFTEAELSELKKLARIAFPEIVDNFAQIMDLRYNRICIKTMRSRWGSCSSRGNLNFNCLLMLAPDCVIDYIVIHELSHLRQMNHSRAFYAEVSKYMPNYREAEKWLKTEGSKLLKRL